MLVGAMALLGACCCWSCGFWNALIFGGEGKLPEPELQLQSGDKSYLAVDEFASALRPHRRVEAYRDRRKGST